MNGGFTLGGKTARQLGIRMLRSSQRPILPSTVDRTLTIPGLNGAWDFGADVGPRYLKLDCAVIKRDARSLQMAAEDIAVALVDGFGKPKTQEFIFDMRPDRFYQVRYAGSLDLERISGYGRFVLPFVAFDPFARALTSSEHIILDSDLLLDTDLRLDDDFSFSILGEEAIEINNWGTLNIRPTIVVEGSFVNLSITANGKTFNYNSSISNESLVIDGDSFKVKLEDINALPHMTGDFVHIVPGINGVSIGGTGLDCTISFIFHPKYL